MSHQPTNYRTAESVSPGHPDKLCDQISDAILDAYLKKDPTARVAVEVAGGHGKLFIVGEVTSTAAIDLSSVVKRLSPNTELTSRLVSQSPEIASGVDGGGAGDQGIMVGYATAQTQEQLPREVVLSRALNQYLYNIWPSDGKTQITLKKGKIATVVASFQNAPTKQLTEAAETWLQSLSSNVITSSPQLLINPAGEWQQGGFEADAGLTGRKLVVDNYGPHIPIGGGCFSGKDATKVDRSAAYMARKIAKDYLKRHQAKEVYCHLAYAIGYKHPVEAVVTIDSKQHEVKDYDLTPNGIINFLDLQKPQYEATARWGHFGHPEFKWEQ